ncbi:MAG: CBS domain-containing protein [Hyphomicrobiaceae bacterium]|jgi:CBS domain-containing protein|nr:CBS domain-containing protein [Hyphomicrobiaceae bacterium]
MSFRLLASIVRDRNPVMLPADATVQQACSEMWQRRVGSVLVVDRSLRLRGIFTGRDAVRALAEGRDAGATRVEEVMTRNPVSLPPGADALDALHVMCDGGFRHVPVVDGESICGVVSRGDFKGVEIDRIDEEEHLWECVR